MFNLMKNVLPSETIQNQDKLLYLACLSQLETIRDRNNAEDPSCCTTISNLLKSSETRFLGLQLLEISLQQNFEIIYPKGQWIDFCIKTMKASNPIIERQLSCHILTIIIPYLKNMPSSITPKKLMEEIFPFLLKIIDEDAEWALEACICVKKCMEEFPRNVYHYVDDLLMLILKKISDHIYSDVIHVLAECFCRLPYCTDENFPENVQHIWKTQFRKILKTIEKLQSFLLSPTGEYYPYDGLKDIKEFTFIEGSCEDNFISVFLLHYRRFINMCKCLSMFLSKEKEYSMMVPFKPTLEILSKLFSSCSKVKLESSEQQLLCSFIPQMLLAGLSILEPLIVNRNIKYIQNYIDIIKLSMECCFLPVLPEPLLLPRAGTWKILRIGLDCYGRTFAKKLVQVSEIKQAILADISINSNENLQVSCKQKSKEGASLDPESIVIRNEKKKVCLEALHSISSLLYAGAEDFTKETIEEISSTVFKICELIYSSHPFPPFPYDDENCREELYSIVSAFTLILKPDLQDQVCVTALRILNHICHDRSFIVKKLDNRIPLLLRYNLIPARPSLSGVQKQAHVPNKFIEINDEPIEIPEIKIPKIEFSIQSRKVLWDLQGKDLHSEECSEIGADSSKLVVVNESSSEQTFDAAITKQCQGDIKSDQVVQKGFYEELSQEPMKEAEISLPRKRSTSPTPLQVTSETNQIVKPEIEELVSPVEAEENDVITNKDCYVYEEISVLDDKSEDSISMQVTDEDSVSYIVKENKYHSSEISIDSYDSPATKRKAESKEDVEIDGKNTCSLTIKEMKKIGNKEEEKEEPHPSEKKFENYDPPAKKQRIDTKDDLETDKNNCIIPSPPRDEIKKEEKSYESYPADKKVLSLEPPAETLKIGAKDNNDSVEWEMNTNVHDLEELVSQLVEDLKDLTCDDVRDCTENVKEEVKESFSAEINFDSHNPPARKQKNNLDIDKKDNNIPSLLMKEIQSEEKTHNLYPVDIKVQSFVPPTEELKIDFIDNHKAVDKVSADLKALVAEMIENVEALTGSEESEYKKSAEEKETELHSAEKQKDENDRKSDITSPLIKRMEEEQGTDELDPSEKIIIEDIKELTCGEESEYRKSVEEKETELDSAEKNYESYDLLAEKQKDEDDRKSDFTPPMEEEQGTHELDPCEKIIQSHDPSAETQLFEARDEHKIMESEENSLSSDIKEILSVVIKSVEDRCESLKVEVQEEEGTHELGPSEKIIQSDGLSAEYQPIEAKDEYEIIESEENHLSSDIKEMLTDVIESIKDRCESSTE